MTKLAVFVEGQTEQVFLQRLVREVAGAHRVSIKSTRLSGGARGPRRFTEILASKAGDEQFYVLIFDCGGMRRVVSDIRARYQGLVNNGYSTILGLRDVFPEPSDLALEMVPQVGVLARTRRPVLFSGKYRTGLGVPPPVAPGWEPKV